MADRPSPAIAAVAAVMDEIDQCRNPMPCDLCRQRMQSILDMGAAAERERAEALTRDLRRAEALAAMRGRQVDDLQHVVRQLRARLRALGATP